MTKKQYFEAKAESLDMECDSLERHGLDRTDQEKRYIAAKRYHAVLLRCKAKELR